MTTEEFRERFKVKTGDPPIAFDDDGIDFTIEIVGEDGDVLVSADLGPEPENAVERGLLRDLLAANNAFGDSGGATFSLDSGSMHISLQRTIWIGMMDSGEFLAHVTAFVEMAKEWRSKMATHANPLEELESPDWFIPV